MTFEIYDELIGQTFKNVINIADKILSFQFEDGSGYVFYHYQDCCEDVYIEDICGDLYDLEDTPILTAQVIGGESLESDDGETYTDWYFYKFETIRGSVVIRWCGTSNGCYSTKVQMKKLKMFLTSTNFAGRLSSSSERRGENEMNYKIQYQFHGSAELVEKEFDSWQGRDYFIESNMEQFSFLKVFPNFH